MIAGPKSGSLFTPRMTSVPPATISCTSTPSMRASGTCVVRVGHDLVEGRRNRLAVGDTDANAAGLGLVRDVGRLDLQRDGKADLGGRAHRLVASRRERLAGHRDSVRGEHALRLELGQILRAAADRGAPFRALDRRAVGSAWISVRRRCARGVLPQRVEAARTSHRRAVARDAGLGEDRIRFARRRLGRIPRDEDRHVGLLPQRRDLACERHRRPPRRPPRAAGRSCRRSDPPR